MGPERGPCASGSDVCAQVRTVAQDVATPAPAPFRGKYPPKTPSPREGAETLAAAPGTAPDLAGPGPGAAAVPESSGRRSGDAVPPDSDPATSGSASGTTADTPATPRKRGAKKRPAVPRPRDRLFDAVAQYTRKGDPLLIEGRLQLEQWTSREGEKRSKLSVVAERVQLMGKKGDDGGGGQRGAGARASQEVADATSHEGNIPF